MEWIIVTMNTFSSLILYFITFLFCPPGFNLTYNKTTTTQRQIQMTLQPFLCLSVFAVVQWDWSIATQNTQTHTHTQTHTLDQSAETAGAGSQYGPLAHAQHGTTWRSQEKLCASSAGSTETLDLSLTQNHRSRQLPLWGNVLWGFSQQHKSGSVNCKYSFSLQHVSLL